MNTQTTEGGRKVQSPTQVLVRKAVARTHHRVVTDGKHLVLGGERFVVRGATYGSFVSRPDGARFPMPGQIGEDFGHMASMGLNTVRVYTAPTADLLEAAADAG